MKIRIVIAILSVLGVLIASCQNEQSLEFKRYYTSGSLVYQSHCQNCHGVQGEGLKGLIPPLTDSIFMRSNLSRLPCIIKNGLKGQIDVNHRSFEGEMAKIDLNPMELAQVITYINNSFGNQLGQTGYEEVIANLAKCK